MKIWFDKNDINFETFVSEQFFLLPFFSKEIINKDNDFKNNQWKNNIKKYINIVEDKVCADIFLYPKKFDTGIVKYLDLGKQYNKKVYSFYNDDNSNSIASLDNLVLYRTSVYASKKKNNEHAMPAWSQDLFVQKNAFRRKQKKPVISFCGFLSHPIRKQSLEFLNQNHHIDKSFIIRDSFWGGQPHNIKVRNEYIANIVNSDFVLCCRGAGNFSYRLYETLSCGRIPIIVDTDCLYPCSDCINWSEVGLFNKNIESLNDDLNSLWGSLSEDEYIKKQLHAREIYEKFIAPDGFTRYLAYNF